MPQINELPNEVLETMTKRQGLDLSRVEPDPGDAATQATGGAPAAPNYKQLGDVVDRMRRENGPIKEFNVLLAQRERYNENMKRLNQTQADDMLKQRAKTNRELLSKMFLGG
jgi:hypothetical protein